MWECRVACTCDGGDGGFYPCLGCVQLGRLFLWPQTYTDGGPPPPPGPFSVWLLCPLPPPVPPPPSLQLHTWLEGLQGLGGSIEPPFGKGFLSSYRAAPQGGLCNCPALRSWGDCDHGDHAEDAEEQSGDL